MGARTVNFKASKVVNSIAEVAAWIGYVLIAAILLVVFLDVAGRFLLNRPLRGSIDFVIQFMGLAAGFSIMYAAVKGQHVALELLIERFPRVVQAVLQAAYSLLGAALSFTVAYHGYLLGVRQLNPRLTTDIGMPVAPFTFLWAVAVFLCGVALLGQAFYRNGSNEIVQEKEL